MKKGKKKKLKRKESDYVDFFLVLKIVLEQKTKKIKKQFFLNLKNSYKIEKSKQKLLYLAIKYKNYTKKKFPEKLIPKKKNFIKNKISKKTKYKKIDMKFKRQKKKKKNNNNKLLQSVCFNKSVMGDNDYKSNINFRTNTNCIDDILFLQLEEEYMEKVTKKNSNFTSILGFK